MVFLFQFCGLFVDLWRVQGGGGGRMVLRYIRGLVQYRYPELGLKLGCRLVGGRYWLDGADG